MDIPIYPDTIFNIKRHLNCDKSKKKPQPTEETDEETIKN
jgi:hypothetical protein